MGNVLEFIPPRYLYNGIFKKSELALAQASDTPRIAFAPKILLFSLPSSWIIVLSISHWFIDFLPIRAGAIILLTLLTAFSTLLPQKLSLLSRSSTASKSPFEAPDGTAATPEFPEFKTTSTSIVGFPRESKICLAEISFICEFIKFASYSIENLKNFHKYFN